MDTIPLIVLATGIDIKKTEHTTVAATHSYLQYNTTTDCVQICSVCVFQLAYENVCCEV